MSRLLQMSAQFKPSFLPNNAHTNVALQTLVSFLEIDTSSFGNIVSTIVDEKESLGEVQS